MLTRQQLLSGKEAGVYSVEQPLEAKKHIICECMWSSWVINAVASLSIPTGSLVMRPIGKHYEHGCPEYEIISQHVLINEAVVTKIKPISNIHSLFPLSYCKCYNGIKTEYTVGSTVKAPKTLNDSLYPDGSGIWVKIINE